MRRTWFVFKGVRHWVWRDAQGRIAKWGFKAPEIKLPIFMYRYTYAINYGWSNKYYSYRLQKWSVDSEELARERPELKRQMEQSFERYRKCSFEDLEAHGDRIKTVGDTIERVAFDLKLIGRVEIVDEKHA